jgi:hypothetical protein
MLRKIGIIAVLSLIIAAVAAVPALAANPHFIGTPTLVENANGSISASGKAAGLAGEVTSTFLTASSAEAVFRCQNKGQNLPPGQPVATGELTGPVQNINPRNGQITFRNVTLSPPPAPSVADECPNARNWTLALQSITYFDVTLHLQQNGVDVLTHDFGDVTIP